MINRLWERLGFLVSRSSRLICYELNEVPWRVLDFFCQKRPNSFLATNIHKFDQITTHTRDTGELHPWSTWPTMHRGVPNTDHNIRYINQDLAEASKYPPVWEILCESGITCGVFGSLQSFPPYRHKNCLFHVPDTFAPHSDSFPSYAQTFQNFNLRMAGRNKAEATNVRVSDYLSSLKLLSSGIRLRSFASSFFHVLKEGYNPLHKSRRPMLQADLSFDVFFKLLKAKTPDFVTFFTNHVAGTMHRYWKHSFPDDFEVEKTARVSKEFTFHSQSIIQAMEIADGHIGQLHTWSKKNGYEIIVSSSMGQEAIDRGRYLPELMMTKIEPIASLFGMPKRISLNPAMQPDVALEFVDLSTRDEFMERLSLLKDSNGETVLKLRYQPKGLTMNLSIAQTKKLVEDELVHFDGRPIALGDLGFKLISRDPGTGYHQPHGVVLFSGKENKSKRKKCDSTSYLPTILDIFKIAKPSYCSNGFYSFYEEHDNMVDRPSV